MAEKRMIAKSIVDSDTFLNMPQSTQNLYFHLNVRADDDGFVDAPKKIMRFIGASEDDMKVLLTKRYLLGFDSGVIVIKHWRIHNTIRADRKKNTLYKEEFEQLYIKDDGAYTDSQPSDNQVTTKCPHRLDKIRLEENSIDKIKEAENKKDFDDFENLEFKEPEHTDGQKLLIKNLCKAFGISEMNQPQNYFLLINMINLQINNNTYDWFKNQVWYYFKYKTLTKEKTHGFKTFIGDLLEPEKGGWNADNWEKKYKEIKAKEHTEPKSNIQPSKTKRIGGSSTLKELIKK